MKLKQLFIILFLTGIITTTINATELLPDAYTTSHSDSSGIKKIKKTKWYIQAGILSANAKESYTEQSWGVPEYRNDIISMKSFVGFKVGLNFDIPFNKRISFSSGLNFIQKGTTLNNPQDKGYYKMNFIEMPLNLVYRPFINNGLMFGIGFNLSYGIGGKDHEDLYLYDSGFNTYTYEGSFNQSIKFDGGTTNNSDNNTHFKAMEIGSIISLGYKISNHYTLKAEYSQGFTNLFVDGYGFTNGTFKTSYFDLNFCYGL